MVRGPSLSLLTVVCVLLVVSVTPQVPVTASVGTLDRPDPLPPAGPVVVATFDTGTNPFHPCFRSPGRDDPAGSFPGYPEASQPLNLTFAGNYATSLQMSRPALDAIEPRTLYHIPETRLSFYGSTEAKHELVDSFPHGAQASSQIVCDTYGMGGNAQLVVLNHYHAKWRPFVTLLDWATAQDWIDIIHLNIQDLPQPTGTSSSGAIGRAIASGKMVVVAAGNGAAGYLVNYPMELSTYNGPPGSLVVGATDDQGYTLFSNLQPHIAADGGATLAAAPFDSGSTTFSGTSSASALATGYVARVLGAARLQWGHDGNGLLTIPSGMPQPTSGPLADGVLTAAELHEVVRKTADGSLASSQYDGGRSLYWMPASPVAETHYAKAGYGKVSEVTAQKAVKVASGDLPSPERLEDAFYMESETVRATYWGSIWS